MNTIIYIVWAFCGYLCYTMAWKKGYNKTLAAVLGVLGGFISVIVYACLKNKKEEKKEGII